MPASIAAPGHPLALLVIRLLCLILSTASLATAVRAGIILDSDPWERWRPAAESRRIELDHRNWSSLLGRYLSTDTTSGIHLFDYAAVTPGDRQRLDEYIDGLAGTPVADLTPAQQQALWINLYNALTVRLILDNPGVDSIRDIKPGFFSIGPWGMDIVEVNGVTVTLNDIEHRILRPLYGDPRVHFAVNCASMGCPDLQPEPWRADTLEQQYEQAARAFVQHPRGLSLQGDTLTLSKIFSWYGEDFGEDRGAVLHWLAGYAEPQTAARLRAFDGRVRYAYDWSLNAAP